MLLPPISSVSALVVFAILSTLWIATINSPARSVILGLSLALSYAATEVLLPGGGFRSFAIPERVGHFILSILSNLHWPLYLGLATWIHHRFHIRRRMPLFVECWFAVGLPALFVLCEAIPRPLPWKLGHSIYQFSWVLQGSEFTGVQYLSFGIIGMGSLVALLLMPSRLRFPDSHPILALFCLAYWLVPVWGMRTAESTHRSYSSFKTALPRMLQLEMLVREKHKPAELRSNALPGCVTSLPELAYYAGVTEMVNKGTFGRDLVFWPTMTGRAAPDGECRAQLSQLVTSLKVPILFSLRMPPNQNVYLLEPNAFSSLTHKSIHNEARAEAALGSKLLLLPWTTHSKEQRILSLISGESIGVTFESEAMSNKVMHSIAENGIYVFVHLGLPALIGFRSKHWLRAFDTIRSIEYRVPSIRIDNEGRPFIVDPMGGVIADFLETDARPIKRLLMLPLSPPQSIYRSFNDWFTVSCAAIVIAFLVIILRRKTVPIPLYVREAQRRKQSQMVSGNSEQNRQPH